MKNLVTLSLLFIIITNSVFSQQKINKYKYIIVPVNFEFLNKADQYKTSSLTKFLFNKNGFNAYLSNEQFPKDLAINRCLGLIATVKNSSNFFNTKNTIVLKDCYNNTVYVSKIGKSKFKNFKKAHHESIRNAFKSIATINYKYSPDKKEIPVKVSSGIKKVNQVDENIETNIKVTKASNILYAQPKDYGFQLVNTKPEVVFKALKTNKKDVYILSDKNGILYKNDNNWVAEYYENGKIVIKYYQIKF